jgi:2',3'-cyclic-nucleotide 2'-phosphodiesterase (5'-nucleotidase family)
MKCVSMLLAVMAVCTGTAVAADPVTIVYTGNTEGKLETCSCPSDPYGGLIERATLLKDLRTWEKSFLLVDAGRSLSLFGDFEGRSAMIMQLMSKMKYDAVGIDTFELFYGVAGMSSSRKSASFPLLSATVAGKDGKPAFTPCVVKKLGSATVAIISLCDSTGIDMVGDVKVHDFTLLSPEAALKQALRTVTVKPDYVVVLSTMEPKTNTALLKRVPEIDLIIEAYGNRKSDMPRMSPDGVIVCPGGKGQFLGLITLSREKSGAVSVERHEFLPVLDVPADIEAESILDRYDASLGR